MSSVAAKIAKRYLVSGRKEAFINIITIISILGVAIGVVVINVTMAIMTGFEYELKKKILEVDSHIVVKKLGGIIPDWEKTAKVIEGIPEVTSLSPFTYTQALLRADGNATGVLVRGIKADSDAGRQLSNYLDGVSASEALGFDEIDKSTGGGNLEKVSLPGIVIGNELSRSLGLFPGMTVSLLSPQVGSTPLGLIPKFKRFVVTAIYKSGLVNYENALAYIDLSQAQQFFRMGNGVSGLEVRLADVDTAPKVSQEILNRVDDATGFYAQDWTSTNKPLWDAIKMEKNVYFIVLLLIIVMASFSIISTLVLLVLEKRGDVAILRTLGAKSSTVGNIFRIQGALIGGVGTVLGLIFGLLGCLALREYGFPLDERIFPISQVPVRIDPINFLIVGAASFLICFVATIYPARRASSLDPASVLRYE